MKQIFMQLKPNTHSRVSTPKMIRYNFTTDNYFQKQITHTKFTKYFLVWCIREMISGLNKVIPLMSMSLKLYCCFISKTLKCFIQGSNLADS